MATTQAELDAMRRLEQVEQAVLQLQQTNTDLQGQLTAATAGQHGPALAPRAPSLKPHKPDSFEGKDKDRLFIHDWTFQLKTYYGASNITDDAVRLSFAVTLLRGPALRWWRALVEAKTAPSTWDDFAQRITAYFLPQGADTSARNQLERHFQRGSVAAYTDRFRAIADLITNMADEEKKVAYTRGLKEAVQLQVAFAQPSTFEDTVILAHRIDDILFSHSAARRGSSGGKYAAPRGGSYGGRNHSSGATDMELGSMQSGASGSGSRGGPSGASGSNSPPPLSKLTDAERARLRSIGACFRCRQAGHTAMQCPLRAKQQGNGHSQQ